MSNAWPMIVQVVTGTTLYLYGLEKLFFSLENLHGEALQKRLGAVTCHNLCGWLAGVGTGALLLSNRALLALLGELAASNLLACRQTMQMLLGGVVGTFLLALLLFLLPPEMAVIPLAIGPLLLYATIQPRWRITGHLLLGIGVLFLGLTTLNTSLASLSHAAQPLSHPWIALPAILLAAAAFGSAHVLIGVLLPVLGMGLLDLPTAMAMTLAANFGAALPLSPRHIRESSAQLKRLFLAHLVFQSAGVLATAWWLPQATEWLTRLTVSDPWRLLIFHGLFTLMVSLIGLPLLRPLVALGNRLLPDPYGTETPDLNFTERYWPRYLDDDLLDTPTLALAMARREVGLIAALIEEMLAELPEAIFSGDPNVIARLRKMDDRVDEIHRAVTRYLAGIGGATLPPQAATELMGAMTVANELEAIGDIIENNFTHLAETQLIQRSELPAGMRTAFDQYHGVVSTGFRQAADAFLTDNPTLAHGVMAMKESITTLDAQGRLEQMQILRHGGGDFSAYILHMDLYENFKRIFYHAKRIAKAVAGE